MLCWTSSPSVTPKGICSRQKEQANYWIKHRRMDAAGKYIERFLHCADESLAANSRNAATSDARRVAAANAYDESYASWHATWMRLYAQVEGSTRQPERAACARAWIGALTERQIYPRIEQLLTAAVQQAGSAASPGPPTPRYRAARVALHVGEAGFALLEKSFHMARVLTNSGPGSTQADKDLGEAAMSAMTQGSVLQAAATAARALVATAAQTTRSGTTSGGALVRRKAAGIMYGFDEQESIQCDTLMATAAAGVCTYTWHVINLLHYRLDGVRSASQGSTPVGGSGSASPLSSIPPGVAQLVESLVESQLLAAAAAAVLDCPNALAVGRLEGELTTDACGMLCGAAIWLARSVVNLNTIEGKLWTARAPEGRLLAAKLLRAARHGAVVRLQVALLDQLAAHAGMGAELEREAGQREEVGQGQEQVGAWAGSSGSWWFAREEARRGQLLGVVKQARGQTAGLLEDHHCTIVLGAFRRWCAETETQLGAEAGVPVRPPPLLAARLVARAAEALCRLCRGQGLGGAYAPAPMWSFAKCQVLVMSLVPRKDYAASLPAATARACLPHWLEAAGWAVALMSDAAAAAMGRRPATQQREADIYSVVESVMVQEGTQLPSLAALLPDMIELAANNTYGFKTLSATAQADVRRRLFRCGLAASLDHTLRLHCSTQDSHQQQQERIHVLRVAPRSVAQLVGLGIAPMLPPPESQQHGGGGGGGGGRGVSGGRGDSMGRSGASTSDSGEAASSSGGRPQLGLLLTLSKRAAMLTRALELEAGALPEGGEGKRATKGREVVTKLASEVLGALVTAVRTVQEDTGQLGTPEGAAAVNSGSGGDAAWGATGDEAEEALALAVRAACNLAAPWAWQLAADLAGAADGASITYMLGNLSIGVTATCDLLPCVARWCHDPVTLPPAQLLACQPHRLLAAACALAAALPAEEERKRLLGMRLPGLLVSLAPHKELSGRVRGWLVPSAAPTAAAHAATATAAASTSSGGGEVDACAGCLSAPLQSALRHTLSLAPHHAMHAVALMRIAVGEIKPRRGVPCGEGGRDATREADGGFQQCAAAMAEVFWKGLADPSAMEAHSVLLPDGSVPGVLLEAVTDAGGKLPPPPPPSGPPGPLPPPLALPSDRASALPRLRMCGNPRCSSFAGESEGALPFKQCGGCRAVRYCGAECQRVHWREGHKAECKELAAGAAAK